MNSSMSEPDVITAYARATAPISLATVDGTMALYIILCTLVMIARMVARYYVHQRLWWDDWSMMVAWLGLIGLCLQQIIMAQHGGGVNFDEVPTSEFKIFAKNFSDLEIVARLAIFFAKLSILLLYIRIFFPPRSSRTAFYWVIQATIWLNLLYTIALVLVVTLQCVPEGLPEGSTCVNEALVLIMASVINIISDIAVLIIPLGALWRLQLSGQKKMGLFALFAFGALAPLASIGRLGYQIPEADGKNKTVIYMIVSILATAEQAIAIVVGSVPVASAWVLKQHRKGSRNANANNNRTFTDRVRPSREGGSGSGGAGGSGSRGRRSAKGTAPDPYRITNITRVENDSTEEGWQLQSPPATARTLVGSDRKHEASSDEELGFGDGRVYGLAVTTVKVETTPREWPSR